MNHPSIPDLPADIREELLAAKGRYAYSVPSFEHAHNASVIDFWIAGNDRPHIIIVQRFVDGRVDLYRPVSETNKTADEIAALRAFLNG